MGAFFSPEALTPLLLTAKEKAVTAETIMGRLNALQKLRTDFQYQYSWDNDWLPLLLIPEKQFLRIQKWLQQNAHLMRMMNIVSLKDLGRTTLNADFIRSLTSLNEQQLQYLTPFLELVHTIKCNVGRGGVWVSERCLGKGLQKKISFTPKFLSRVVKSALKLRNFSSEKYKKYLNSGLNRHTLFTIPDMMGMVSDYAGCPPAFSEIITPLEEFIKIVRENHVSVGGQLIVHIMENLTFMVDPAETIRLCHALVVYINQRLESNSLAKKRALRVCRDRFDRFYMDLKEVEVGAKCVILLEELRREEKLSQEAVAAVDERLADILECQDAEAIFNQIAQLAEEQNPINSGVIKTMLNNNESELGTAMQPRM